ncbi:hypothetical protein SFRURICE_006517, partial [Spodoptera frugiperda]
LKTVMNEKQDLISLNEQFDDIDTNSVTEAIFLEPGVYYPKNRPLHSQKSRTRPTKQTKRFVFKNGDFNIDKGNTNHQGFFSRWFVTMVEARWRWTLVHFFLAFTGDWLFFGFIYWIIARQAVVTLRDGKLCMIFRVGDMRKSRILNIKASVFVLKLGDDYDENYEQTEMQVEMDGCESTFFLWPVSVIHVIDEKSPLYSISAADLLVGKFEILVVFEGVIESTGQQVQARTSYTECDILWGHRFIQMVKPDTKSNMYDVDFSKLCETERIDTPLCSASEYKSMLSLFDLETFTN